MDPQRLASQLRSVGAWLLVSGAGLAIATALACYQLAQPHELDGVHSLANAGYDDGVYLASLSDFVHGLMPYRDFTFLQPPGLLVLLSPLGLVGRVVGTARELEIARVLVLVLSVVNVGLVTSIARCRGRSAAILASVLLACYPLAVSATNSLSLEPVFATLVLVAARIAFDRTGHLASSKRVLVAGVVAGLAADVKVTGVAACVALVVVALRSARWRAAVTGVVLGCAVPLAPFVVLAPQASYHDIVSVQMHRLDVIDNWSVAHRLDLLLGLDSQSSTGWHTTAAALATAAIVAIVAAAFVSRRLRSGRLMPFLLICSAALIAGLLTTRQYYDHYGYAVAAVVAPLLAGSLTTLARAIPGPASARVRGAVVAGAGAGVVVALGLPASTDQTAQLSAGSFAVPSGVDMLVPPGACAISDYPTLLVLSDRWDSSRPCRRVVDPFGLFLSTTEHPPPGVAPYPRSLTDPWRQALDGADYVVLTSASTDYIPWNADLRAAYDGRFVTLAASEQRIIAKARTSS